MGLLSDIGRSNAVRDAQGIFSDVMRYKQDERQSNKDAMSAIGQAHAIDLQDRQAAIQQAEEARKVAQWTDDNTVEDLSAYRKKAEESGHGGVYRLMAEQMAPFVYKDGAGNEVILRKDRKSVAAQVSKDPHLRFKVASTIIQGLQERSDEYGSQLAAAKKKLEENPDATMEEQSAWTTKAQAAAEAKKKLDTEIEGRKSAMYWTDPEFIKSKMQIDATNAAKPTEVKEFIGADGKWYQGTVTGKDAQGNATYSNVVPFTPKPTAEKTFKEGDKRDYDSGDKHITEEYRNGKWEPLASAPRYKPDKSSGLSFADREVIRAMGKNLPKAKALAETAAKNIQKIDRMIELVNRGAGGVKGDLIAKINKVADIFRNTSPEDAKYNTLKSELRGMAGQLRLQLGLIGQTSDRDVQIMYEAAGGGTPAESQKALFEGYKQGYMQDINNYNSDAEAYAGYSKAGKSLYRPVSVPSKASGPKVVEERTLPNGEVWQSLSDGTYKKVK